MDTCVHPAFLGEISVEFYDKYVCEMRMRISIIAEKPVGIQVNEGNDGKLKVEHTPEL